MFWDSSGTLPVDKGRADTKKRSRDEPADGGSDVPADDADGIGGSEDDGSDSDPDFGAFERFLDEASAGSGLDDADEGDDDEDEDAEGAVEEELFDSDEDMGEETLQQRLKSLTEALKDDDASDDAGDDGGDDGEGDTDAEGVERDESLVAKERARVAGMIKSSEVPKVLRRRPVLPSWLIFSHPAVLIDYLMSVRNSLPARSKQVGERDSAELTYFSCWLTLSRDVPA